ncbi:hypothetical protein GCM10010151_40360 [Actinoallomurus spadix]|uniref:Uncharacterized protein n=1 Tax=Actinoallomurus spadix TaxID=79912 RepID=A0ABP3GM28_9ACTN
MLGVVPIPEPMLTGLPKELQDKVQLLESMAALAKAGNTAAEEPMRQLMAEMVPVAAKGLATTLREITKVFAELGGLSTEDVRALTDEELKATYQLLGAVGESVMTLNNKVAEIKL